MKNTVYPSTKLRLFHAPHLESTISTSRRDDIIHKKEPCIPSVPKYTVVLGIDSVSVGDKSTWLQSSFKLTTPSCNLFTGLDQAVVRRVVIAVMGTLEAAASWDRHLSGKGRQ